MQYLERLSGLAWVIAALVLASDTGIPFPQWMLLAISLLVLAAWAAGRAIVTTARGRLRAEWRALLPFPATLILGVVLAVSSWPLCLRTYLSATALRESAATLEAVPQKILYDQPRRVGLFRVRAFERHGDELRFLTNECGLVDACGLVYSPQGPPPNRGEDSFARLYGPWWHWYQSW